MSRRARRSRGSPAGLIIRNLAGGLLGCCRQAGSVLPCVPGHHGSGKRRSSTFRPLHRTRHRTQLGREPQWPDTDRRGRQCCWPAKSPCNPGCALVLGCWVCRRRQDRRSRTCCVLRAFSVTASRAGTKYEGWSLSSCHQRELVLLMAENRYEDELRNYGTARRMPQYDDHV